MSEVFKNRLLAKVGFKYEGHDRPIFNFTDSRILDKLFEVNPSDNEGFRFIDKGYEFVTEDGLNLRVIDFRIQYFGQILELLGSTERVFNSTNIDEEEKETNLYVIITVEDVV